jgi:hypothetical protein
MLITFKVGIINLNVNGYIYSLVFNPKFREMSR